MALVFDPTDEAHYSRLRKALEYNYDEMKPFRTVREIVVEAAKGHYYRSEDRDPTIRRDPVNMMDQLQNILVRSFVQANPKSRITSRAEPRTAKIFQLHVNETIREIDLETSLREYVQEAILGYMGIMYVGFRPTARHPRSGEPFTSSISLPNFVIDMGHEKVQDADFMGHKFSRRIGDLVDNPLWRQDVVASLHGKRRGHGGTEELEDPETRETYDESQGSLFDWVDIWAILIRPLDMVVYLSEQAGLRAPLRVERYDGPEFGPYVYLPFDLVPDEVMPNSRGAQMLDMHDFVNGQYRRIFMKEDQSAEFWTYEGGADEDARRVRDAQDGEIVNVNNNSAINRRTKAGTNPQSLATAIHGRQLFDEMSGQIRRLGGVASNADTATQARIDHANTSQMVRDMQLQVTKATRVILQNIAWIEWTNPTRTRKVEVKVGTGGVAIEQLWSPEIRKGDFIEHTIDIEPDSMEHRTSRQQLGELMAAVQGLVIPLMGVPTPKPIALKVPELVGKYSELANLPELEEVTNYVSDPAFVSQANSSTPGRTAPPSGGAGPGTGGNQPARSPEDQIVERMFSGSVGGGQQTDEEG
jgi:hypothetical protein